MGVLLLCRETVGVFYNPSQLGNKAFNASFTNCYDLILINDELYFPDYTFYEEETSAFRRHF